MKLIPQTFDDLFRAAFGQEVTPFDYQAKLAGGDKGVACESKLISVPTGCGKTAAVVLAWLWNRVVLPSLNSQPRVTPKPGEGESSINSPAWPRRLVYCLPMRTLVEQTRDNVREWLRNLGDVEWDRSAGHAGKIGVHILMGGEERETNAWDLYPEHDAILIGTQDMLLSRALNRGYGMSRYRWPIHFGLLNNDALWVMDETQLMGPALWTSAQLDWMRQDRFPSLFPCPTWWMSATVGAAFLKTSDRERAEFPTPPSLVLGEEPNAAAQLGACRPCEMWTAPVRAKKSMAKSKEAAVESTSSEMEFASALGDSVVAEHQEGTLSLVVCNTVRTAQAVFASVHAASGGRIPCVLLTSRFRKKDRKDNVAALTDFEAKRKAKDAGVGAGLICLSTQVVEAGVDVSAIRLWSEMAPWSSLVQRLGRLNRDGRNNGDARALFFKPPIKEQKPKKGVKVGPYLAEAVAQGERILAALVKLTAAEPKLPSREALARLRDDKTIGTEIAAALQPVPEPYPRAMDIHGLFSTEPEVFGGFTDVSPFVRGSDDDADVTIYWRADNPKRSFATGELDGPPFDPEEGITVPVHRLRDFLGTRARANLWNEKTEIWEAMRGDDLCPGMVLMLRASTGGYDPKLGWTGNSRDKLTDLEPPGPFADKFAEDRFTQTGEWVELSTHLDAVRDAAEAIADQLSLAKPLRQALVTAAAYHDIGKALPRWQSELPQPPPGAEKLWAKAPLLLCVRPKDGAFKPSDIETLLREAGIVAAPAITPAINATENCHCWQVPTKTGTLTKRAWAEKRDAIPGIKRAWHLAFRPGLRHEAASALALWHRYFHKSADFPALAIYLAATHHGKVRTVLASREVDAPNVCGVIETTEPLNWDGGMPMDFACANDGRSGSFSEDGSSFTSDSPGWTSLVADLLGSEHLFGETWEPLAIRPADIHELGPFRLAYLEALITAADVAGSKVSP